MKATTTTHYGKKKEDIPSEKKLQPVHNGHSYEFRNPPSIANYTIFNITKAILGDASDVIHFRSPHRICIKIQYFQHSVS